MAELSLQYSELDEYIDSVITAVKNEKEQSELRNYKPAIMAALCSQDLGDETITNDPKPALDFWGLMGNTPSQAVLKNYHVNLQDTVLAAIGSLIKNGVLLLVSKDKQGQGLQTIAISVFSFLEKFILSIKQLNNEELCAVYKITAWSKDNGWFSKDELTEWFPPEDARACDMSADNRNMSWKNKWTKECQHYSHTEDECGFLKKKEGDKDPIDSLIASLLKKHIISPHEDKKDTYRLVW